MTTGLRAKRSLRYALAGTALLLFAGLPFWGLNAYGRAVEVDHSRFRTSESAGDARQRGVLVRLPEIEDSVFLYAGEPLRVREAWVEEVTQVRYRWYLPGTRRVVGLGTHRLLVDLINADRSPLAGQDQHYLPWALCATWERDTVSGFGSRGDSGLFSTSIGRQVPARIAFHAGPPTCPKRELGEGL